jgi:glyoxylase-like metal-dependent hydrolase (beta-lactamase superfamily II)
MESILVENFFLGCLAHASYLVGSEGIAAVIDPQRDVDIYVDAAAQHGLKIAHIIETHLHADFVSGHRELAERTGARIYLGAEAGAKFPHTSVKDGVSLTFGRCRFDFFATPGHTVESVCIAMTDLDKPGDPPRPRAVFTGDTLFVGDVGRPDLSGDHTPQELAAMLYSSLHDKLLKLPDETQVFPAHGAGSLCGRQMGSERSSTIGKERRTNYALQARNCDEFIRLLTDGLPPRPDYFGMQFAVAHVPGSVHIALSGQYASWAARILGLDKQIILVGEDADHLRESQLRLARVGIENVHARTLKTALPAGFWAVTNWIIFRRFPCRSSRNCWSGKKIGSWCSMCGRAVKSRLARWRIRCESRWANCRIAPAKWIVTSWW